MSTHESFDEEPLTDEELQGIKEGMADIKACRVYDADEVFKELGICRLTFSERAKKDLAKLPKKLQKKIKQAIADYRENTGRADVKKIKTTNNLYRIAVDTWRIFVFRESDDLRHITSIEQRKEAYRGR